MRPDRQAQILDIFETTDPFIKEISLPCIVLTAVWHIEQRGQSVIYQDTTNDDLKSAGAQYQSLILHLFPELKIPISGQLEVEQIRCCLNANIWWHRMTTLQCSSITKFLMQRLWHDEVPWSVLALIGKTEKYFAPEHHVAFVGYDYFLYAICPSNHFITTRGDPIRTIEARRPIDSITLLPFKSERHVIRAQSPRLLRSRLSVLFPGDWGTKALTYQQYLTREQKQREQSPPVHRTQ